MRFVCSLDISDFEEIEADDYRDAIKQYIEIISARIDENFLLEHTTIEDVDDNV